MLEKIWNRYRYELFLGGFFAVWLAVIAVQDADFLSVGNLTTVLTRMSAEVILAVGMTLVIITGGFDLSVGAIMALIPIAVGSFYGAGLPFPIALLAGFAVAAVAGAVNGILVGVAKLQAIIVTLATMTVLRSVVYGATEGQPVRTFPTGFAELNSGKLFGIPIPILLMVLVVAAGAVFLGRTRTGRLVYAIGGNEQAAQASGVRVTRIKVLIYVISAVLAAVAGLVFSARINIASPDAGLTIAFDVIAAVLLGGTSITGGKGSVIRSAVGVLIMNMIINGFNLLGIDAYWQTIFMGAVLIAVVGLDTRLRGRAVKAVGRWNRKRGATAA